MEPASSGQESPSGRLKTDRATAVAVGKGSRGSSNVLETAKGQSIEDRSQIQRRRRGRSMGTVLTRCSPEWVSNWSTGSTPSLSHTESRSKEERFDKTRAGSNATGCGCVVNSPGGTGQRGRVCSVPTPSRVSEISTAF